MTIAQSTTSAFGAACAPASDTYVTAPALNVCFVGCCQQAKEHGEGHAALEIGSTCLRTQAVPIQSLVLKALTVPYTLRVCGLGDYGFCWFPSLLLKAFTDYSKNKDSTRRFARFLARVASVA